MIDYRRDQNGKPIAPLRSANSRYRAAAPNDGIRGAAEVEGRAASNKPYRARELCRRGPCPRHCGGSPPVVSPPKAACVPCLCRQDSCGMLASAAVPASDIYGNPGARAWLPLARRTGCQPPPQNIPQQKHPVKAPLRRSAALTVCPRCGSACRPCFALPAGSPPLAKRPCFSSRRGLVERRRKRRLLVAIAPRRLNVSPLRRRKKPKPKAANNTQKQRTLTAGG